MKLTLLSAIPCSRVDLMPCCNDGRGGWVYSQADPCRCFTVFTDDCYLFFAMSVFAPVTVDGDFGDTTTLVASMNDSEIGRSELEWEGNNWGIHLDDGTVYSWPQRVAILPEENGLVEITISVKLRSQDESIEVAQCAYCHIRQEDRDASQLTPLRYWWARIRRPKKCFR